MADQNRVIYHRVTKDLVLNADYAENVEGENILNISTTYGAISIVLSDAELSDFKDDIASLNQFFMIPSNTMTASSSPALNPDINFYITDGLLDGKIVVSKEPNTNAPYLLLHTLSIKGYRRTVQIYITTDIVDKLDEVTIRDVPFVYHNDLIQTVNLANQPNIIITLTSGEFLELSVPTGSVSALKTQSQDEMDHLNDPLTEQSSISVTSQNVFSQSIEGDDIDTIAISHTAEENMSYLQFTVTDVDALRRSVYTIYMNETVFEQFNTEIQLWT